MVAFSLQTKSFSFALQVFEHITVSGNTPYPVLCCKRHIFICIYLALRCKRHLFHLHYNPGLLVPLAVVISTSSVRMGSDESNKIVKMILNCFLDKSKLAAIYSFIFYLYPFIPYASILCSKASKKKA